MSEQIRRRGRPRTFDCAAALDAAMRLFWRHGYEGTSIADLTKATGVTPPTLYAAFGSKEELYREALAHHRKSEGTPSVGVISDETPARAGLESFLREAARVFTDPSKPAGCMISIGSLRCAPENEAARKAAAAFRAKAFDGFSARLKRAQKLGELPAGTDIDALARFYTAMVQGMSIQALDGASRAKLDAMVDVAMDAWPGKRPRRRG
jgi:AcrR family transcriptional regulator